MRPFGEGAAFADAAVSGIRASSSGKATLVTEEWAPQTRQFVINAGGSSLAVGDGGRFVLPREWFGFILHRALRQALRYTDYLTLVTIRATREHDGWTVDVGSPTLSDIADVVAPTIRETDVIGELDDGRLGLLLLHADDAAALRVIERFAEVLGDVQFSASLAFAIGAACCPTSGIDMNALVAHATLHPVLNVRARPPVSADPSLQMAV